MRILLTTDTIGGVWTFTRELSEGLLQAGHAVALVSFGRKPSLEQSAWSDRTSISFEGRFEYWSSSAPLEWMQQNEHALSAASGMLMMLADRFNPDVLHSNQYCFGSLPIEIPKLITAHSDVLSWAAASRPDGLGPSDWLARYRALVQSGLDDSDAVSAPTKSMLNALSTHFAVLCPTRIIFNGRSLRKEGEVAPRRRQAVSTGRLWDEAKGLKTLFDINSPVPVLVAGEDKFEDASLLPVTSNVQLLGILKEDELLRLFRQSSVYIVTSLYEPFGLAPLEAALCGCAIVARDLPSLREVWGDAVVYFKTDEELSERLRQIFASESELSFWQSEARRRSGAFTSERMTSCYVELYDELIDRMETQADKQQEFAPNAA